MNQRGPTMGRRGKILLPEDLKQISDVLGEPMGTSDMAAAALGIGRRSAARLVRAGKLRGVAVTPPNRGTRLWLISLDSINERKAATADPAQGGGAS